jgi:hypothetical protein
LDTGAYSFKLESVPDDGLSLDEAVLALEDFYERFHTDILNYHGSTIAEFLNGIRWGVHEYLLPEFRRSFTPRGGDPTRYEYLYPDGVSTKLGKALYWDLMNRVRGRPYLERFQVTRHLKLRYSNVSTNETKCCASPATPPQALVPRASLARGRARRGTHYTRYQ